MSQGLKAQTLSKLLSPSAALGGYPKLEAKNFLLKSRYHNFFPNRFFGSVIGTDFGGPSGLVMIRNLQWRRKEFFIESGVGIVAASELEKELAEISLKRKVVKEHYL